MLKGNERLANYYFGMTPLKCIAAAVLSIVCIASCHSQTTDKPLQQTDSFAYARLQAFRQWFWDSLPQPNGRTNDYEGLYTAAEAQQLDSIMAAFERETTIQLCIVTLGTIYTSAEKFEDLALHLANTWGVGQKGKDNGMVICISSGYRQMRICNGYGIEKILSDGETKEIIDNYFVPKFREGEYFQGTVDGLLALVNILKLKTEQDL